MSNNRDKKRAALKERLIDAAEALIAKNGLRGLKARDITADAGCALGALYNAVENLDQLIILVNSRTLNRLGETSLETVQDAPTAEQKMHALGQVYTRFAVENANLWSALFTHRLPEGEETPDWHRAEFIGLIQQIVAPLSELRPDLAGRSLQLRAQTLFAAVHGVVQLSIQNYEVGAPQEDLASEVQALVGAMMRGIKEAPAR
ncbi:MAG: TetR/AcrR family transcriptional regulator [Pseudomonadota bacterium]